MWIRLLRASRSIENELRLRLKSRFDMTLPRFDVMAALNRKPDGLLMSDLSRFLLVSNGNVTVIVDRLVGDGLVVRSSREGDRRTSIVRLTDAARALPEAEHRRLWAEAGHPDIGYSKPEEDKDGWSKWQLWSLMRDFGPHIYAGAPLLFETEIEIVQPSS